MPNLGASTARRRPLYRQRPQRRQGRRGSAHVIENRKWQASVAAMTRRWPRLSRLPGAAPERIAVTPEDVLTSSAGRVVRVYTGGITSSES
jgi:hypothetical protein